MRLFLIVAIVCLAVALLGAVGAIDGVNVIAWFIAGQLAWAADTAAGVWPMYTRRP